MPRDRSDALSIRNYIFAIISACTKKKKGLNFNVTIIFMFTHRCLIRTAGIM